MYDKKLFFIVILSLICVNGLIVTFLGFSLFLKIIITELSVFLVLHVQRWRDSGSDYSLLNNLYTVLAVILQIQSIVLLLPWSYFSLSSGLASRLFGQGLSAMIMSVSAKKRQDVA